MPTAKGTSLSAAVCLALALAALAPRPQAQPAASPAPPPGAYTDSRDLPDTPAYRRAREIVDLINAGDPARVRDYARDAFEPHAWTGVSTGEHVSVFQRVHATSRGFDIHAARHYEAPRPVTNATLIVHNRLTRAWQAIVVDVEETAPHRIVGLQFAPARTPTDQPKPGRLSDRRLARELGAFVERLAKADVFSGTVLLARDGKVLLRQAAGIANRDFAVPATIDTRFNLGSMNKMFTAVAIAQLAEQGKLAYDDPIAKYLGTDWLDEKILTQVTIHHLLTHTSGLGSYFNARYEQSSRALFRRVDDYRVLVQGDSLRFAPGTGWSYSNTGFMLLGAIVEKASGQDYFDYVREHIARPAGMTRTDCYELDRVNENLAVGYEVEYGPGGPTCRNNIFEHVMRGGPAGGGYSTVDDLLRFDQALRSGKLVKPETLALMWRDHSPDGSSYGYGFGVGETPEGRVVGHSGGFFGISANLQMYLDSGWTLAILCNIGSGMQPVLSKAQELIGRARR